MQRFDISLSEILSKNSKNTNPFLRTMILNFLAVLDDFCSCFLFLLRSLSHFFAVSSVNEASKPSIHNEEAKCGTTTLMRGDIEVVMGRLGMQWDGDDDREVEVCNLFDKSEPTLDELKQAFDMFDSDKDGCIGAKDLKKMLCGLGFGKFTEWDCLKMIFALSSDDSDSIESSSGVGFENFVEILNGRVSR